MPYMHRAWQGDSVTFWSKDGARKAFVSAAGSATPLGRNQLQGTVGSQEEGG